MVGWGEVGRGTRCPLYWEHDTTKSVGSVLTSWEGPDGSLRMAASVTNPSLQRMVKTGDARGLSHGTDLVTTHDGRVLVKEQREVSVCKEGRRDNTWIDHINGERVRRRVSASACTQAVVICYLLFASC